MITANLPVVPRGACMAGVAVFCGGLYLAWSYWNHTGNSDETDEKDGNTEETSSSRFNYSAATEPKTHSQSSTVEGNANILQKILNDKEKEKSKNEGKRKRRSTKEELLLKKAIEFTRTQIASTESLSKQLLISEQRKKVVKFSNSPEIITVTPEDSTKKKSSVLKTPNGKMLKDGILSKKEVTRKNYSGDKTEPQENNSENLKEMESKEKKIKSSWYSEPITVTPNNGKREIFSDLKSIGGILLEEGTFTEEEMFRKSHSSDKQKAHENYRKNLKEEKIKEEKMKSGQSSEVINVTSKDNIDSKPSGLTTSNDKLLNPLDGTLRREDITQNNQSSEKNKPQEHDHNNLKEEKDRDKKMKAEVENVLSEVLAVVDCGDQLKKYTESKKEPMPTHRDFVSFMYVNQGYFNSQSACC